jgi:NAD(P)H-hydrate epimerase
VTKVSRRPAALPALPARPRDAHKSSVGRVLVVGGSRGMVGAPVLAARGALRAGAGLVTIAVPASVRDAASVALFEAMTAALPCDEEGALAAGAVPIVERLAARVDAVVVGPGLGRADATGDAVRRLLARVRAPVVLDADGLYAFRDRLADLVSRPGSTVLTPHEGEAEAMEPSGALRSDETREARAARLARTARAVCALKGPGTVVSDGAHTYVNDTGGPVLATGGSGDVLSGVVAALLAGLPATGRDAFGATCLAVHAHGAAGDLLARRRGDRGVLAHEIADVLPEALAALVARGRAKDDGAR